MNRDNYIRELYFDELFKHVELSESLVEDKPKRGYEKEFQESSERLAILEQMLDEMPVLLELDGKDTGRIKQSFVGIIEDEQSLSYIGSKPVGKQEQS